ncbi:MAG: tRNA pseudouridine(13) synthase TruD [Planctomycetota bacterium]|jgi:tRNA pseudouridine13 synthase
METSPPGLEDAPYLTDGVPAVQGTLKGKPEDFLVEEVPLYGPAGEGEHVFIRVEKRGLTTFEAMRLLARAVKCPTRNFGYAGMKDARAVAIQHFTVQGIEETPLRRLALPGLQVLEVSRHRNKLRVGHLKGNRFRIRFGSAQDLTLARSALTALEARGVPNPYMEQRFGNRRNSHRLGRALLQKAPERFLAELLSFPETDGPWAGDASRAVADGNWTAALASLPPSREPQRRALTALVRTGSPQKAVGALSRREKQLYLSAYQAYLFNRILALRLPAVDTVEAGDLAFLHRNGAVFEVTDPDAEAPRARTLEISPSGPIFGSKMRWAKGRWGEEEGALAASERFGLEAWRLGKGLSQKGARRPFRFPLTEASVEPEGDDLVFRFFLPKGCYATAVFREIGKSV